MAAQIYCTWEASILPFCIYGNTFLGKYLFRDKFTEFCQYFGQIGTCARDAFTSKNCTQILLGFCIKSGFFRKYIQSGASSLAKHGGAYVSAVYGSIQDPIAAPGPYKNQEP